MANERATLLGLLASVRCSDKYFLNWIFGWMASYLMSYSHSIVQEAGITLADHHTTSEAFIQHIKKEVSDTTNNSFLFIVEFLPHNLGFLHVLLVIQSPFTNMNNEQNRTVSAKSSWFVNFHSKATSKRRTHPLRTRHMTYLSIPINDFGYRPQIILRGVG